ncbi:ABC transporter ATP-binding protein [Pleomorphomonas sp. PLEO]|uniref:ABC transporter ATP-binding protein n=1 Tax=Pleomorphomonas sp. PLEO TaxID=3239306 RepID=UPI00351EC349
MDSATTCSSRGKPSVFSISNLGVSIGETPLLKSISAAFTPGEMVGLIGHNGSGKSTLLKVLARQIERYVGSVTYDGKPIAAIEPRAFARQIAYLPQHNGDTGQMTVRELVACGRYPWHGALGRFGEEDAGKVEEAMVRTHIDRLADRVVATMSGGERQRAWLAMLVAQNSGFLLLDEPTSALDIAHQVEVLSLIRGLAHDNGLGVVIVLHDVNMAARFCDRILALKGGRLLIDAPSEAIMDSRLLGEIYGLNMGITRHPELGLPLAYVS